MLCFVEFLPPRYTSRFSNEPIDDIEKPGSSKTDGKHKKASATKLKIKSDSQRQLSGQSQRKTLKPRSALRSLKSTCSKMAATTRKKLATTTRRRANKKQTTTSSDSLGDTPRISVIKHDLLTPNREAVAQPLRSRLSLTKADTLEAAITPIIKRQTKPVRMKLLQHCCNAVIHVCLILCFSQHLSFLSEDS